MSLSVWLSFFFAVTVFGPSTALNNEKVYIAQKIMLAYEKLLNYVNQYAAMLNLDAMYGIVLAEAQLEMMVELPMHKHILGDVTTLKWRTHYVVDILRNFVSVPKGSYEIIYRIMDYKIWMNNASICSNQISHLPTPSWDVNQFESSIMNGLPDEVISDKCISDLIGTEPFNALHACNFASKGCKEIFEDVDASNGYPLVHKVLYWQMAKAINCTRDKIVDKYIKKICSRVYAEAKSNAANGFPPIGMDLFLEQVSICGMEGYTEFLSNRKWAEKILKWQTDGGCYGYPENTKTRARREALGKSHIRTKRASDTIAYGCDSHMTGVAAIAMMSMLRSFVTEPEWNKCPSNSAS